MARRTATTIPGSLALVTGAGSGIGRATALALAREGAAVLCADLDLGAAQRTADDCAAVTTPSAPAGRADASRAFEVDVADAEAMGDLAKQVEADHGALDVLVNNAGVGVSGHFLDTGLDDWDWILGVNLRGVIHGCRAFGPSMVERGRGHVVIVSSALGYTPRATEPAYITTKAGVLALARCLRADWARHGVGVSAICPGVIATPIVSSTRFLGERSSPKIVNQGKDLFAKRGHRPELVGDAIVDAVRRNRPVVPVGLEAHLGWWAQRVLPLRAGDRLATATLGGL
jgi:NAD(P)-dependent dehydrogenase (short-subunit alcohol dehydrogenase family)